MKQKYIIDSRGNFAIFSELITHSVLARALSNDTGNEIVGAGFCNITPQGDSVYVNVHCFGESVSLGIKSREEDEKIINEKINNLNRYGY